MYFLKRKVFSGGENFPLLLQNHKTYWKLHFYHTNLMCFIDIKRYKKKCGLTKKKNLLNCKKKTNVNIYGTTN